MGNIAPNARSRESKQKFAKCSNHQAYFCQCKRYTLVEIEADKSKSTCNLLTADCDSASNIWAKIKGKLNNCPKYILGGFCGTEEGFECVELVLIL